MTRLLLFQKVESNGGPIFKVDLECQKKSYEHFLIYIYGIQCDFMQKIAKNTQKSPKKVQKTDHSIAIYSNFLIGMVYFGYHLVNPHVQTVQNMYGKGG